MHIRYVVLHPIRKASTIRRVAKNLSNGHAGDAFNDLLNRFEQFVATEITGIYSASPFVMGLNNRIHQLCLFCMGKLLGKWTCGAMIYLYRTLRNLNLIDPKSLLKKVCEVVQNAFLLDQCNQIS